MKRWYIPLGVLLALGVAAAGYWGFHSARPAASQVQAAPPTVPVERGAVSLGVTAPGRLVGKRETALSFGATGKLLHLSVRAGQHVEAGATLARLDPAPLQERVTTAQTELELARARLAKLEAGPTPADTAAAQGALASAQARLDTLHRGPNSGELAAARADLAAAEAALAQLQSPDAAALQNANYALETAKNSLWSAQVARDAACGGPDKVACDQGQAAVGNADAAVRKAQDDLARIQAGPTADQLRLAEAHVARARGRLAQVGQQTGENDLLAAQLAHQQAQAGLDQLNAGPSAVDLRQAQATVQAAEQALSRAQAELAAATLVAPYAGVVLEVNASEGETVAAGAPVLRLTDPTQVEAEATVVEEDFPLVKVGQKVELFFDAMPAAAVTGRVARIVPQRSAASATPVYPVYIALDEVRPEMAPGMTVDASVVIDKREDVLRLPRSLVRTRADDTATLKVWNGVSTEERTVKVGLRGNQYVEILSGLAEGDQVVSR
jgi:HlyD family secretion protein